MTLVRLASDNLEQLRAALESASLPTSDIADEHRTFFQMGEGNAAAFAGIEGQGSDRLIRSVVVPDAVRGAGLGAKLVKAVERAARQVGVERLHLLTNTAEAFFIAQGYERRERSSAPPSIAASREFTSLCPSSAAYLTKEI